MGRRGKGRILPPQPRLSRGEALTMVDRYLERGLHYLEKRNLEDALADLDEAINLSPKDAELYVTRGWILAELERNQEATDDLEYAVKRDPGQWLAHYFLGLIAMRQNNHETAIQQFSQAQRIVPHRPELFFARSIAHYQSGDVAKAAEDADIAEQVIKGRDKLRGEIRKLIVQIKKYQK